jgi:hypothetical protein
MKISGMLVEKGFHVFDAQRRHQDGYLIPRLWLVVANKDHIQVWRSHEGVFEEIMAADNNGFLNQIDPQHCEEEHDFVEKFAGWLSLARKQDVFDRIIIVATTRMLGIFRKTLPTNIAACVAAEIPRDFTHMNSNELKENLRKIMAV